MDENYVLIKEVNLEEFCECVVDVVIKRLMADVSYVVFFFGGFDFSLIIFIVVC